MEKGGKGLSIQRRRAHAIGAEIGWTSDRSGTRMTLWLPYVRTGDQATGESPPALGRAA
jgi:hypothetical protein